MKMPGQLSLAMRNLLRHRARTAATLAAISIGVASLILVGGFIFKLRAKAFGQCALDLQKPI